MPNDKHLYSYRKDFSDSFYETASSLPGVGQVLKSAAVARTLQGVYHRLNSKAQKYRALTPEERERWESYYAEDQKELAELLRAVQVIK